MTSATIEETKDYDHVIYLFVKDITCTVTDDMRKCQKRCSKFSALLAMHALQRRIMNWRTRSNTAGFCRKSAVAQAIPATRSNSESTAVVYTAFFNAPQRKLVWCCYHKKIFHII